MKNRTGDHLARRSAAKAEPSPITALRDMLASAFAADISAVTPEVCEVLRDGTHAEANRARRDLLRNALVVLARQSGALSLALTGELRARFDAKLVPGESPLARTTGLYVDDLSPVDDATLKLGLALDQCASRLREQTSAEVSQLTARLCEMLEIESLADADNPVLPRVFARSLLEAIGKLGFDDEAKLAVFKAYGPALLHIAPDVYSHANSLLAELGAQPGFKAQQGTPLNPQPVAPARPPVADEKALATILERLLDGDRDRGGKKAKQLATQ
jgi:Protein of unknown function (DUF1631)